MKESQFYPMNPRKRVIKKKKKTIIDSESRWPLCGFLWYKKNHNKSFLSINKTRAHTLRYIDNCLISYQSSHKYQLDCSTLDSDK